MTISKSIAIAAATLFLSGAAMAQATAPAPTTKSAATPMAKTSSAPATTEKKPEKPRTAASLACSKDADAKNVHGKERKKFMSECKKTAAAKT